MSTLWTESIARIRQLRHEVGHTLAIVVSLAIGMAMCVAVYSVVDALVFATIPGIQQRQTLVRLAWTNHRGLFTPAEFQLLAGERGGAFAAVAAQGDRTVPVMTPAGSITASAAFVSAGFFETLGTRPVLGRLLSGADVAEGVPAIVVSERFWRGALDGRADVIGSALSVGGRPYTIVGVAPPRAPGLRVVDVGTPDSAYPQLWIALADAIRWPGGDRHDVPWLSVAARLRPDADVRAARSEAAAIQPRLVSQSFLRRDAFLQAVPAGLDWRAQPIDAILAFGLLMFLPLAVLAIGCVNVVNLQLARAVEQVGELSLRVALGASRGRLLWILSVDVALLSLAAGVLGWLGGSAIVAAAAQFVSTPLAVDTNPALLVAAMVVAAAALTGLLPAWLSTRDTVATGLRLLQQGGGRVRARARRLLVALQLAGSLPLLALGGLAAQALIQQRPPLPPDADRVLVSEIALADVRSTPPRPGAFVDAVLERLTAEPSIETAAFATFAVAGHPMPYRRGTEAVAEPRQAFGGYVTPAWFDATGARVLAGRPPSRPIAARSAEVVINAALASAIGREGARALGEELRLTPAYAAAGLETATIVSVVADTQRSADGQPVPMILRPMPPEAFPSLVLVAKARDAASGRTAIQRAIAAADPAVPAGRIESFGGRVGEQQFGLRGLVSLGLIFGVLALALAALGLYALQAYTVRRRSREIGIRMAIGAERHDILWLIVRQALLVVSIGTLCGLAVAVPMSALMRFVLAGTGPFEPWALLPAIGVLFVVSIAASAGPAWRAASVDPVRALRQD